MSDRTEEVTRIAQQSLTVRQLIEQLQSVENQDAPVLFVCTYGDYHRTQQALTIDEVLEEVTTNDLATSAYSQSGLAFNEPSENKEDEEWYCEPCDKMWDVGICPLCNAACVNEDGDEFSEDSKDEQQVVILR